MKDSLIVRYKNVIIFKKSISFDDELKLNLSKINKNCVSITICNDYEIIYIDMEEIYILETICNLIKHLDFDIIKNSKEFLFFEMLESLSNNDLGFIDIPSKKYFLVNFTEIISGRNLADYKAFLTNYNEDPIVCFFVLRDMIENLKVYLYLLRAELTQTIIKTDKYTAVQEKKNDEILKKKIEQIEGNIKMNFNFSKILENTPTIAFLSEEFSELDKINKMCNDWVHKNGYEKINVRYFRNIDKNDLKDKMFYILKVYFAVVCCYDDKSISASDYFDSLECNEEPPCGSESWIAPVFQNFIDKAYTEDEKSKIVKNSYMEIK